MMQDSEKLLSSWIYEQLRPTPTAALLAELCESGMVPLSKMIDGHVYGGACRDYGTAYAIWHSGETRSFINPVLSEWMRHPENDIDGRAEIFVPVVDCGPHATFDSGLFY